MDACQEQRRKLREEFLAEADLPRRSPSEESRMEELAAALDAHDSPRPERRKRKKEEEKEDEPTLLRFLLPFDVVDKVCKVPSRSTFLDRV